MKSITILALILMTTGCSSFCKKEPVVPPKVIVETKIVKVEIPESIMSTCEKPANLIELFPNLQKNDKVLEREAVNAIVTSYLGYTTCYTAMQKVRQHQQNNTPIEQSLVAKPK